MLFAYIRIKKNASSDLCVELALAANVVLSRRVVPWNSRSSYSQRVFELGRVISFTTARPLDGRDVSCEMFSLRDGKIT